MRGYNSSKIYIIGQNIKFNIILNIMLKLSKQKHLICFDSHRQILSSFVFKFVP